MLPNSSLTNFEQIFSRIFLDRNIVHCLVKYGEEIFNNQDVLIDDTLSRNKYGTKNIESLRNLFGFPRSNFRLIISPNIIEETMRKRDHYHTQYVFDLKDYCDVINEHDGNPHIFDDQNQQILDKFCPKIGFLSKCDKKLIFDAIRLRCYYFMTMDEKLLKNKDQIKNLTGLNLIRPFEFWNLVKPFMGLLA